MTTSAPHPRPGWAAPVLLVALAAALCGCHDEPYLGDGLFRCEPEVAATCPPGFACVWQGQLAEYRCLRSDKPAIVIGAIIPDDISPVAKLRLAAAEMAVEQINATGALSLPLKLVNRSPAGGAEAWTAARVAELVRTLHDSDGAVAVISHSSDLAEQIIAVTNTSSYSKLVQCNGTANRIGLNTGRDCRKSTCAHDRSGAFYRTVVDVTYQTTLMARLIKDSGWTRVGIYEQDEQDLSYASGRCVSQGVKAKSGAYGSTVATEQTVRAVPFEPAKERAALDKLIGASKAGTIDALVVDAISRANEVIAYLTENGFVGGVILSEGSITGDLFVVAGEIDAWLKQDARNRLVGVKPDGFGSKNAAVFKAAFKNRFLREPNCFHPAMYDCVYAIALALLVSGDARHTPGSVHGGITAFTESELDAKAESFGIGAWELKRAAAALEKGAKIRVEGASGPLVFTDEGDRPSQPLQVVAPDAKCSEWVPGKTYQPAGMAP